MTVSDAVRVTPANAADIVTGVDIPTDVVVTVKLALVAPAGTVTFAGVEAAAESSERDTVMPPLGAAPLNVTVPFEEVPPTTLVGLTERADSVTVGAAAAAAAVVVVVVVAALNQTDSPSAWPSD